MNFVFAVKAVFVFVVESLDLDRADGALGFPLLTLHVAINDFFFLFAAEFPEGRAAGAEVGEKLGPVVVKLLALHPGDLGIDDGCRDLFFLIFAEFFDDQDAVDQVLNDTVLEGLNLGVVFLFVTDGFALETGEQRGDFATHVGDGDDLVLGHGDDAIGVTQIEVIPGGGDGRLRAKPRGGERGVRG